MKMRTKTLLILSPAFIIFAAVLVLLSRYMLLDQFTHLERNQVDEVLERTRLVINNRLERMQRTTIDYARWDTFYENMQSRDAQFLAATFNQNTFENHSLNFVIVYDTDGNITYARSYSLRHHEFGDLDPLLLDNLNALSALALNRPDHVWSGFWSMPRMVAMISKSPIIPSTRTAPPRGHLVFGQFFSTQSEVDFAQEIGKPVHFEIWPDQDWVHEAAEASAGTYRTDRFELTAFHLFNDLRGNPALLARVTMPRDIYNQGREVIALFLQVVLLLGLGAALSISILLRRQILDRVAALSRTCKAIATDPATPCRLPDHGSDEISQLGGTVNNMLDRLENARHEREVIEQRFLMLVEESRLGVYLIQGGLFQYVNTALATMCGYASSEELKGHDPLDVVHPEDRPIVTENLRRRLSGEVEAVHYSVRFQRLDGRVFHVEIHGHSVVYHGARAIHGIIQDITQRRQAEDAVRAQTTFLRTMIEHLPLAVWAKRAGDRRYVLWNHQASRFFGIEHDRVLGNSDEDILPAELALRFREEDDSVVNANTEVDIPKLMIDLPGRGRLITHMVKVPIRDDQNRIQYILGLAQDITEQVHSRRERRQLEKRMQQAQKLESLGVLAGGIAHDFNNLLVSILGNVQLAGAQLPADSRQKHYLNNAELAVQRSAELCQQLLAYAGKGRFLIQCVNLASVVEEMLKLLEVSIHRRADLRVELEYNLPPVEGDITQLRQVIMNLITNAADAMNGQRGTITIRTGWQSAPTDSGLDFQVGYDPPGMATWLEIADTGCGIETETLVRIFEPFYSTKMVGRGLGLSAVQGIVRSHGGSIRVISELGEGSVFRIIFPAAGPVEIHRDGEFLPPAAIIPVQPLLTDPAPPQMASPAAPAASALPAATGSGAILIIDDEAPVREVAEAILESAGFEVLSSADGESGLDLIRAHPAIGAVLLDLTMPGLSGEEVFAQLRSQQPDLPIILMSGYSEDDILSRFPGLRPTAFVQKPFRFEQLIEAMQRNMRPTSAPLSSDVLAVDPDEDSLGAIEPDDLLERAR